jgi:hypothetical protein
MKKMFEYGNYVVYYQYLKDDVVATIGQITQKHDDLISQWPRDVVCGFKPLKTYIKTLYKENCWLSAETIAPLNFHLWDEDIKALKDEAHRFSWDILWSIKYTEEYISSTYFESDIIQIAASKIRKEKGLWRSGLLQAINLTIQDYDNQLIDLSDKIGQIGANDEIRYSYHLTLDKKMNLKKLTNLLK